MNFILSNEHRKYMGLKELKDTYDMLKYKSNYDEEIYLFFEGNIIKKLIYYMNKEKLISMCEMDVNYITTDDRKMIYNKKNTEKLRKLSFSVANSLNGEGNYFSIKSYLDTERGSAIIGNFTTERTFYYDGEVNGYKTIDDFKKWCDKYVKESTKKDLEDVWNFAKEKRQHVNYKEGDYFRVKFGRDLYGYGRILMDIAKRRKQGLKYETLFGKPLIVEMFYIITKNPNIEVKDLENLKTFPSQHIMDNNLYYGDYKIIGHGILPLKNNYPIMYLRGKDLRNCNKIKFECGEVYKEIDYNEDNLICPDNAKYDFSNSSIGFNVNIKPEIIKKCIKENSNDGYWEYYKYEAERDLRSPQNRKYLRKILKQFGLQEKDFIID